MENYNKRKYSVIRRISFRNTLILDSIISHLQWLFEKLGTASALNDSKGKKGRILF